MSILNELDEHKSYIEREREACLSSMNWMSIRVIEREGRGMSILIELDKYKS